MKNIAVIASAMTILASSAILYASSEIQVEAVRVDDQSPSKYILKGTLVNCTIDSREVIYLAQISFYEKAAPSGDLPASILRKNGSVVLRPGERRDVAVDFVSESTPPKGSIRLEPSLRIRRQREWNY